MLTQFIAVAFFKISKVLKYPLVFVVFNLLFLFCISQHGVFSNLLFAFFFSLLALVLLSLLLEKFVFSKEKKIIRSQIQYEEIGKHTLIQSMLPAFRLLLSNATRAEVAGGAATAGAVIAAENYSNTLQGQAAESVANHDENEAEICEATGRPANAAHHIYQAHCARTRETLRPFGGPLLGSAYTALQEQYPNASTLQHEQQMTESLSQTAAEAARETQREHQLQDENSAHNIGLVRAENQQQQSEFVDESGMAAVRRSNEEWRARPAAETLTENACHAGRAIANTPIGDTTIGAIAANAASRHIGLYLSSSDSDSGSSSSSSSDNDSNNDLTLNFVREFHFRTDFDPYSRPKLPVKKHSSSDLSDFDFKVKALFPKGSFDSQSLNTEETKPTEDFKSEGIKDKKTQSLESSKSREIEDGKLKSLSLPKLERTKRVDQEFFDALDQVQSEKKEQEMIKSLEPKKDFFPQENEDENNK